MSHPKHIKKFYSLNNETLEYVTTNPYPGITISNDLKWHTHISTIIKKANSTLGFLRRNVRRCPINSKRCLRTRSHSVGPIPSRDIDIFFFIQHRAARFITGDYRSRHPGSVTTMLTNLNLDTLDNRRRDQRLIFIYQIVMGSIPALLTETFFRPPKNPTKDTFSLPRPCIFFLTTTPCRCFIVRTAHTEQFKNSFLV